MTLENPAGPRLIVDGTADLLYRDAEGTWQVVDYKFTDAPVTDLQGKYRLQLGLYMEALRRLVGDSTAPVRARLVAIGKDRTREIEISVGDSSVIDDAFTAARALHPAP